MNQEYACLQIAGNEDTQTARERLIYAVTAYMDKKGLVTCNRENADRTVKFMHRERGWLVYDDQADRLDVSAMNGLGNGITAKLHTQGVGVMGAGEGLMLCLYTDGRLKDQYITSRRRFAKGVPLSLWVTSHRHALRFRRQLAAGVPLSVLAEAFEQGQHCGREVYPQLRELLCLDSGTEYGFASVEDGVITLYFCTVNRVKQPWLLKWLRPVPTAGVSGAG